MLHVVLRCVRCLWRWPIHQRGHHLIANPGPTYIHTNHLPCTRDVVRILYLIKSKSFQMIGRELYSTRIVPSSWGWCSNPNFVGIPVSMHDATYCFVKHKAMWLYLEPVFVLLDVSRCHQISGSTTWNSLMWILLWQQKGQNLFSSWIFWGASSILPQGCWQLKS